MEERAATGSESEVSLKCNIAHNWLPTLAVSRLPANDPAAAGDVFGRGRSTCAPDVVHPKPQRR